MAIIACDLAEVIGTAIALQLLFGMPLVVGAALTAADVLLILLLQQRGFRQLEAFVIALIAIDRRVLRRRARSWPGPTRPRSAAGFLPRRGS